MNEVFNANDRNLAVEILNFLEVKAKYEVAEKTLKEKARQIFRENPGLEKLILQSEAGNLQFTYVAESTRKVVDVKALKEQGLYDDFTKESKVSDSVRISWSD